MLRVAHMIGRRAVAGFAPDTEFAGNDFLLPRFFTRSDADRTG